MSNPVYEQDQNDFSHFIPPNPHSNFSPADRLGRLLDYIEEMDEAFRSRRPASFSQLFQPPRILPSNSILIKEPEPKIILKG
jgi:hypothetical protein